MHPPISVWQAESQHAQAPNKQGFIKHNQQRVTRPFPLSFPRMHLPAATAANSAAVLHAFNKETFYYISPPGQNA